MLVSSQPHEASAVRIKGINVEQQQVLWGDLPLPAWLVSAEERGLIFVTSPETVAVATPVGLVFAAVGWWVVQHADLSLTAYEDEAFHRLYREPPRPTL